MMKILIKIAARILRLHNVWHIPQQGLNSSTDDKSQEENALFFDGQIPSTAHTIITTKKHVAMKYLHNETFKMIYNFFTLSSTVQRVLVFFCWIIYSLAFTKRRAQESLSIIGNRTLFAY